MFSFYNIFTVARMEVKTLLRSWFFRIFSIIAIAFIGIWDFASLAKVTHAPWAFRGIPSTIPYISVMFLNTVQAVIAVFLASDFLKRDKKLDTTEVVYMRSMTNGDYVTGKTLGILLVFFLLNLVVLLMGLVMQLILADVAIAWKAYLLYPLIISLPTLVFILGLSFLFMVIFRNQAITFIVILGYIATTLSYLAMKFNNLLDYMAFNVPMMHSSVTGFADMSNIILHRGIYLVLGLSFISFTIINLKRLPQSRAVTGLARISSFALLAVAIAMMVVYIGNIRGGEDLRAEMGVLGDSHTDTPLVTVLDYDISLIHEGMSISATTSVKIRNDDSAPIEKYIFNLNPGLVVDGSASGGSASISRDLHILTITPDRPLLPGAVDSFEISYGGSIDERACYPDILESDRRKALRLENAGMVNMGKRYSFVTPGYVLLTPESGWYPVPGPGFIPSRPEANPKNLATYDLDVTTTAGMTVVAQGTPENNGDGRFIFHPEYPLPSMTLSIGEYEFRSIEVDSVQYGLYIFEGHDFFSEYFTEVGDTMQSIIRDISNDAETRLGLEYPYKRLTLLEVPIHFYSYRRLWSVAQETVQPEIVLLPEMGLPLRGIDFRRIKHRLKRTRERTNETASEIEDQSGMLTGFARNTLLGSSGFFRFSHDDDNPFAFQPSYNIFPNYVTFTNSLESDRWPVLGMSLEAFYAGKLEEASSGFARFITGLSPDERINLALQEKTLQEIVADRDKRDMAYYAIKEKGDYLFTLLKSMLGEKEFDEYLATFLQENRFSKTDADQFVSGLENSFGFDFAPHIDTWYSSMDLPGFLIGGIRSYKVLDGDRERYQVRMKISNPEESSGLVEIRFRRKRGPGGRGGFMRRMMGQRSDQEDELTRQIDLAAGQNLELGFILDYHPGSMEINTLISRNIPSVITESFADFELEKKAVPFDGQRELAEVLQLEEPGEIIVDNEDPGFKTEVKETRSMLKRLLPGQGVDEDEKYHGMIYWRNSPRWLPTTNSRFYGRYVRSAHFTNNGKGDRKVSWSTDLAESGFYDIYSHVAKITPPWRHGRDQQEFGINHFLIHHDDGIEDTEIELNSAEEGWNFLGSYYISSGTTMIEMTNKSEKGRFVTADAVKWVKR